MGKSITPKYVLDIYDAGGRSTVFWLVKEDGRPTEKNLIKYIQAYIDSLKPNGANYHLSEKRGYMPIPHRAIIRTNDYRNEAKVIWNAPMFMKI